MQRSLHHEILNHAPDALSTLNDEKSANAINEQGLSYLELAVRENMFTAVLHLVRLGVDINQRGKNSKTPLYIAVEYGHTFLASALLALGADKNQAIDIANELQQLEIKSELETLNYPPELIYACLMIEIGNQRSQLIPLLTKQLKTDNDLLALNGLIAFAFCNDSWEIGKLLMRDAKPTANLNQFTFGFWAVKGKKYEILNEFCGNNIESWVLTLQQLHHVGLPLNVALNYAPAEARVQFKKTPLLNAKPNTLSPILQLAYEAISNNDISDFDTYYDSPVDVIQLLEQAVKDFNFIALAALWPFLIKYDVDPKSCPLLAQYMEILHLKTDVYELLEEEKQTNLDQNLSLAMPNNKKSILYSIISHGLRSDMLPSPTLIARARNFYNNKNHFLAAMQRCLQDRYAVLPVNLKLVESKEDKPSSANHDFEVVTNDPMSARDKARLAIYLNRFKINLQTEPLRITRNNRLRPPFKDLPPHIWGDYILPCLDTKAMRSIPSISLRFHEYAMLAKKHHNVHWKEFEVKFDRFRQRDDRKRNLEYEVLLMQRLLDFIDEDKDKKAGCSLRNAAVPAKKLGAYLALEIFLLAWLYFFIINIIDCEEKIGKDPICIRDARGRRSVDCDKKYPEGGYIVGLIYSGIFAIFGLIPVLVNGSNFFRRCGGDREIFNEDQFEQFASAQTLLELDEIKACQPDPLENYSKHGLVKHIYKGAQSSLQSRTKELNELKQSIDNEHKAEEAKRSHEEKPKAENAKKTMTERNDKSAMVLNRVGHFSLANLQTPLLPSSYLNSEEIGIDIDSDSDDEEKFDLRQYKPSFVQLATFKKSM